MEPPADAGSVVPLELSSPAAVDLTTKDEQTAELVVRSTAAEPADIWLILSYASDAIDVQTSSASGLYQEKQLRAAAVAAGKPEITPDDLAHPDRLGIAPSLHLRAGESRTFHFNVRRKPQARDSARLIVKAVTAGGIVRREIAATLPPPAMVELAIDGPAGCWSQSETRRTLFPFPNRKTTFRLSLTNRTAVDRTVDVELLGLESKPALDPPAAPLTAAEAASVLGQFGSAEAGRLAGEDRCSRRRKISGVAVPPA